MSDTRAESLSGRYEGSFAYLTIRDRMPVILTRVIDAVHQKASNLTAQGDQERSADARGIVSKLSKLKNEMQTNKPLEEMSGVWKDAELWNKYLGERACAEGGTLKWYDTAWLLCECYMYRRIFDAFQQSEFFKDHDPFQIQKDTSFTSSVEAVKSLAQNVLKATQGTLEQETMKLEFETLLEFCLWGNKCDLSISGGADLKDIQASTSSQLKHLKEKILVDNSNEVWSLLNSVNSNPRIDFILDNAGFELFTDLCLAEFLLSMHFAKVVYFHVKDIPWFVSDASRRDFMWTLEQMTQLEDSSVIQLGEKWKDRIKDGSFTIKEHHYWTLAQDYSAMSSSSPDLHNDLAKSKLIFFKGDLNYRKLVGDRNWPFTTAFAKALHGFCPAPLCALRTLKADLVVGLKEGQAQVALAADKNWMVNGTYAVIQYMKSLP